MIARLRGLPRRVSRRSVSRLVLVALALALCIVSVVLSPATASPARCLLAGDSIVAGGLIRWLPECQARARGGINSWQFNQMWPQPLEADVVVISLGTNDHSGVRTARELAALRVRTNARLVIWLLPPIKPHIQAVVRDLAGASGDLIHDVPLLQRDGIHPSWAGSDLMARRIRELLR